MRCDIYNGILSGLLAGIVFGIMMQMMNAPTPEGGQMPMMAMVAMVVRSGSIAIHLRRLVGLSSSHWCSAVQILTDS